MNATVSCYNDILEIHATVALKSRDLFFYLWTLGFWYNISQSSGSVNNYWNWWISEKVFVILKKFPGNTKMKIKTTVRYHFKFAKDRLCLPLQYKYWNIHHKCGGIWKWVLWQVIRSWSGTLISVISALIKEACLSFERVLSPFYQVRLQWKDNHLWIRKWALTRHWMCQCLDLGFFNLQNNEK